MSGVLAENSYLKNTVQWGSDPGEVMYPSLQCTIGTRGCTL
jgi:hypothetical protein